MAVWETLGASDEWYTPKYIFDAIDEGFDLDVAAPFNGGPHVPTAEWFSMGSLEKDWWGFVWMNPPFGGNNGLKPWIEKFFNHGNGIALTPDRSSSAWWHDCAKRCDGLLVISGRVKFIRADGTVGKSPSCGTTLWASGERASKALKRASKAGLGLYMEVK